MVTSAQKLTMEVKVKVKFTLEKAKKALRGVEV